MQEKKSYVCILFIYVGIAHGTDLIHDGLLYTRDGSIRRNKILMFLDKLTTLNIFNDGNRQHFDVHETTLDSFTDYKNPKNGDK